MSQETNQELLDMVKEILPYIREMSEEEAIVKAKGYKLIKEIEGR